MAGCDPAMPAEPGERMSGHHTSTHATSSVTPEEYLADRQRMWSGVTHAALAGIICVVVLLIGMAEFLL